MNRSSNSKTVFLKYECNSEWQYHFFSQRRSFASQTLMRTRQKAALGRSIRKNRNKPQFNKNLARLGFDLRPTAIKRFRFSRTNHSRLATDKL